MVVVPQPISDQQQQGEAPAERPGLYVVDAPAPDRSNPDGPDTDDDPAAALVEPLAPWDQRIAQAVSDLVEARPRWNQVPPSYAQTWAYSRTGDWTTSSNPLVRGVHAALTLAALAVVFPLDWLGNVIRDKPSGFMITVVVIGLLVLSVSGGG
ncbi:hypothetical protein Ae706Ps2_6393 [Pseudonocardia sp. Ae706_Ps2]|nr:hypothetical protein Ae331Ps2_6315c [Pseudonocardia sp. Ae331_Ps2]OLM09495.1 hypothetical protein Ae706Ps2_6393 [Pseudonocardia sp. Ae706_Ps2]